MLEEGGVEIQVELFLLEVVAGIALVCQAEDELVAVESLNGEFVVTCRASPKSSKDPLATPANNQSLSQAS